jgi:signal transduction histidine kinase
MQTGRLLYDHDPALTLLALTVGGFASFTALELAGRIRAARTSSRRAWLVGAALALGGAIWATRSIAMLALRIDPPVGYDAGDTLLSLLLAMIASGLGLWLACRPQATSHHLLVGGAVVGIGIAAADYTGMAGLRLSARIEYDPALAALSVLIAVVGATVALGLAARRQGYAANAAAGAVMTAAIAGMVFAARAAAMVLPTPHGLLPAAATLSTSAVAIGVAVVTVLVLGLAHATAIIDARFADAAGREASLREATIRAELANRAKSEFLALMSHEFRTPLNAIIGFSEMMHGEMFGRLGNERYRDYINDIHASGVHLLALINDLLDLSKAEADKLELRETYVDAGAAISHSLRMVASRAERAGVALAVELPQEMPLLWADERRLTQILLNLLTNAVKFTPRGGEARVSADWRPEGLAILVRDTGVGIAPEDMPRVVIPFVQVGDIYSRPHEGSGLGLPFSKRLMEIHGGTLELASTLGEGTTVTILFPASRVHSGPSLYRLMASGMHR